VPHRMCASKVQHAGGAQHLLESCVAFEFLRRDSGELANLRFTYSDGTCEKGKKFSPGSIDRTKRYGNTTKKPPTNSR